MSAMGYLSVPLLDDATTGTSGSQACHGFSNLTIYVDGQGTISGGTLVIEEAWWNAARENTYAGTWSQIGTVDLTDVSGGAQLAYHAGGSGGSFAYANVRVRVSSDVTGGGTISVALEAC